MTHTLTGTVQSNTKSTDDANIQWHVKADSVSKAARKAEGEEHQHSMIFLFHNHYNNNRIESRVAGTKLRNNARKESGSNFA